MTHNPTTKNQRPTTNNQQPTTNDQQPMTTVTVLDKVVKQVQPE